MTIQGVRLSDGFVTDARPKNWREGVLRLFPNGSAPLFALTAGIPSKMTDDPEYHWWEKKMETHRIPVTADPGTGSPITVGQTGGVNNALIAGFHKGHIIRFEETDELALVTADPVSGDGNLALTRGYSTDVSGVAATTFDFDGAGVNPNIHTVGTSFEENSDAPTGVSFDPTKQTNFTQIFRDTFDASRTAINTRLRTGDQVREAKRETLELHSATIEKALWFGQADDTQSIGGNIARTTGGVFQYIDTANVISATAGSFTYAELLGWLEQAFRFGSTEKMGFCGNLAMLNIQEAIRKSTNAAINVSQGQKEFGMNVTRLLSPFGTVVLKTHPLFNQITSGTTTGTDFHAVDTWLAILDMDEMVYRFLRNSDTQFESNLQANGLDGMKSGYLTECGLEIHHPTSHFLLKDLAASTAG